MSQLKGNDLRGYHVREHIECCANCAFGGFIGAENQPERMCVCEVTGEPEDGNYARIAVEPLGICDVFKANVSPRYQMVRVSRRKD